MAGAPEAVTCGPFEVLEPVGSGGMGAVYRGRHRESGEDVAVKVMTVDQATDPSYRRAFRREAQALAQLHHPSIADIYDFGTVSEELAAEGPIPFQRGAPWFAMEFVEGTSVGKIAGVWTWEELEPFLLAVLDALAHAHARGVLHRDLTASNILVEAEGGAGSIQVVDFGLARLAAVGHAENGDQPVRGTPRYMAPEQILGEWRDQGPWTDLYSLGCLAWRITCGRSPFEGDSTQETFEAHFTGIQQSFDPKFSIPEDFEPWLRGLMEQNAGARCRRAADAAWALLQMDEPEDDRAEEGTSSTWEVGEMPTLATVRDVDKAGELLESGVLESYAATVQESNPMPDAEVEATPATEQEAKTLDFSPPPLPPNWKREAEPVAAPPLSGAGVELFGLRRLPLVDRQVERDRLWHALCRVHEADRPVAILMTGPAGSGKTRLSQWLGERAHELGAASVIDAGGSAASGGRGGIAAGIVRHFGCEHLGWGQALDRLTERFEAVGIDRRTGLTDAAGFLKLAGWSGDREGAEGVAGFRAPAERNAAVGRVLRALTERRRPLVVRVDDAPQHRESVEVVDHVLTHSGFQDVPVLFVLTARRSEWHESALLQELARQRERSRRMEVGPLDQPEQRELVQRMLRFDESVVDAVVRRTEGHPLFAVQLVQSWIDSRALRHREGRFVLDRAALQDLPEDLDRLWSQRIEQLVDQFPDGRRGDVRRALEAGSVFGKEVDAEEWGRLCQRLGIEAGESLLRRMTTAGLGREREHGWEFQHGMLAESLRAQADRAGRLEAYHRSAADVLEELYPDRLDETAERRAEHWMGAGEPERALEPLLRAARYYRRERGDLSRSTALLESRRALMDAASVPEGDRRRVENRIELAENAIPRGEPQRAGSEVDEAGDLVDLDDSPELVGRLEILRSRLARSRGDAEASFRHLDEAERIFRALDCRRELARTLRLRSQYRRQRLTSESMVELFDEAMGLYESVGDVAGLMRCQKAIAWTHLESNDREEAERIAKELIAKARAHGERILEAHAFNILAEVARRRDDWGQAIQLYERSHSLWDDAGSRFALIGEVNLALAHAGAGRWERAETLYRDLEERLPEQGLANRLPHVHIGLVGAAATREDWEQWDDRLERFRDALERNELRLTDFAWMAERGAQECEAVGASGRARELWELAADLWRDLGRDDNADEAARRASGE